MYAADDWSFEINVRNISDDSLVKNLKSHSNWIWSLLFSHKSDFMISGSTDDSIKVW
jgi:WD40 repeat protein